MRDFVRTNPRFALCGLNCCLCPRYHTEGTSRCPGCGGENFTVQHPTCPVETCNRKHDNVEFCFQCREYPCPKYRTESTCDSFVSYKSVKQNFAEAARDLPAYERALEKRCGILRFLLDGYNDGRSKGLFCLAANDLPLADLEALARDLDRETAGMSLQDKARTAQRKLTGLAARLGQELKLRKPT